ncbi:isomerase [Clostridiaceae bacterium OF09-1]|nr:isomerase [Clostridiaceae bacterium OF09-1]
MKRKVLAMMMSLTLAMAVTACGGSDTETDAADTAVEETVDDTAEADEAETEDVAAEDTSEEADEDLGPLYSIEAAVAPDVAGTTWHFVGAMLSGEELDAETATGVLNQNYGGTLDMVFDEDGNATMEQGGGNLTGTYEYVDEYTLLVSLDNSGSTLNYACAFAEDEDGVTMVLMNDDTGYNGIYFMQ